MTEAALELKGIVKTFPGVRALDGVDFICRPGEVHAIVGENGSGKSTLIKVAAGVLTPDAGTVTIDGERLTRASPRRARKLGLLTAYQDTALVPQLTGAENCLLSAHSLGNSQHVVKPGLVRRQLARFDLPFSLDIPVALLSPGARQLLEVVRALSADPKILVLDEPTATMDAEAAERLRFFLRTAADASTAIVYISHRLEEVELLADRVTVLRDGAAQATLSRGEWRVDDVVRLMIGVPVELAFPPKSTEIATGVPALEVTRYSGHRFGPVNLHIQHGEIVGLSGAELNGQREIVRALAGLIRTSGDMEIDGAPTRVTSPRRALAAGVQFLSGDRAVDAIFSQLSVMGNTTVRRWRELGPAGWTSRRRERREFASAADTLGIVAAAPDQPIGQLSGGNQQKAVIARAFLSPSKVLVLDEPTQGVDARARLDIYQAIRNRADAGSAVLVNSSDSSELVGLCDRVYVISRGTVVEELSREEVTDHSIVRGFVAARHGTQVATEQGASPPSRKTGPRLRLPRALDFWLPLLSLSLLILLVGAYGAQASPYFLTAANLSYLFVVAIPVVLVAIGQLAVLIIGGFDISVGATVSLTVVLGSFVLGSATIAGAIPGVVAVIGVGVLIGLVNSFFIRILHVNPLIATIGMLGVLSGLAIVIREQPGGLIGNGITTFLTVAWGYVPVAFLVVIAIAIIAEIALRRSMFGLAVRSTGWSEEASRRTGLSVGRIKVGGYVVCAVFAVLAGLFLATQLSIGDNSAGASYALPSFAACFLGGAGLGGGKGSFFATALAAFFLALLGNVAPAAGVSIGWVRVATGALSILAVAGYSFVRSGGARSTITPAQPALKDLEGSDEVALTGVSGLD